MNANGGGGSPEQAGVEIAGQPITANNSSLSATSAAGGASAAAPATISSSDLAAAMQAQGLPASAQSQILAAVLASHQQQQLQHGAGSTVDMASVLAKIQALEREKADLRTKLEMTNTDLSKYREEKSVGMKDKYIKEMKDFIDGLQLKDPEIKSSMHARMEDLAKQGKETGVWEILACASSNHRTNVNQIETLTSQLNSYKEKERQLQGGLFQAENSRIDIAGTKRHRPEGGESIGDSPAAAMDDQGPDPGNIWGDFQEMIMRQGGNRGADFSSGGGGGARFDPASLR